MIILKLVKLLHTSTFYPLFGHTITILITRPMFIDRPLLASFSLLSSFNIFTFPKVNWICLDICCIKLFCKFSHNLLLFLFLLFNYLTILYISNFAGFLYPAYVSFKAVKVNDTKSITPWLIYWIVIAFFIVIEGIADIFIFW